MDISNIILIGIVVVAGIVKKEMENAVKMRVAMQADVGIGKTWYESK